MHKRLFLHYYHPRTQYTAVRSHGIDHLYRSLSQLLRGTFWLQFSPVCVIASSQVLWVSTISKETAASKPSCTAESTGTAIKYWNSYHESNSLTLIADQKIA